MLDKLTAIEAKYSQIEARLAAPETYDDPAQVAKLNKEQSELQPLVETFRTYRRTLEARDQARELMSDSEMKELAQEEYSQAMEDIPKLDLILRVLLPQSAEGIRRVALPLPPHLHIQHLCGTGQLRRGQRGHLQTLGGIGAALRQCLMRRDAGGDQQQKVQSQLLRRRLCRRDMAPVNGVKGPAVNTDLHITRSSSGP